MKRRNQLIGTRERRGDAVGPGGDGGLDVGRLYGRIVVRPLPHTGHAHVVAGSLHAALHDGPERALVRVRDHVEGEVTTLTDIDLFGVVAAVTGVAAVAGIGGVTAGIGRFVVAATGRGDHHESQQHGQPTHLSHFPS